MKRGGYKSRNIIRIIKTNLAKKTRRGIATLESQGTQHFSKIAKKGWKERKRLMRLGKDLEAAQALEKKGEDQFENKRNDPDEIRLERDSD